MAIRKKNVKIYKNGLKQLFEYYNANIYKYKVIQLTWNVWLECCYNQPSVSGFCLTLSQPIGVSYSLLLGKYYAWFDHTVSFLSLLMDNSWASQLMSISNYINITTWCGVCDMI